MKASLPIFVLLAAIVAALAAGAAWAVQQAGSAKTSIETAENTAKAPPSSSGNSAVAAGATYAGERRVSSPPAASGEAAYPDADALLRQSVAQLGAAGAIEAKLRQKVNLFDRELIGAGQYAQLGAGVTARLRLEMRIGAGESATELLQICDGETLWTFNAADGKRSLRRVDLDRIQAALEQQQKIGEAVQSTAGQGRAGQGGGNGRSADRERVARGTPIQSQSFGIGGLPWMLDGLRLNCNFTHVAPMQIGELQVLALHGSWRKEKVLRLLADDEKQRVSGGGEIDPDKLPAHLADQIVVYLGRDDLFPYRIDYLRSIPLDKKAKRAAESDRDAAKASPTRAAAASSATPEFRPAAPIMTLELYEVRFGGKLDRQMFTYKPGQAAIDDTQRHLDRLK
jgi:hypothetical protein